MGKRRIKKHSQDAGVDAANVRAALEADPDSTWSIDDYIKEFSTPAPGAITYLCIKRGDVTNGITNVALVFGENPTLISQAALGEDNVELLRLPFENMAIAFTRINNGSAIMEDSMMQSIGDDAFATTDEDSDAAYIQRAEEEAAQRKILEEKQRANQRESLVQLLLEAEEENKRLIESNQGLQRKLVKYLQNLAAARKLLRIQSNLSKIKRNEKVKWKLLNNTAMHLKM